MSVSLSVCVRVCLAFVSTRRRDYGTNKTVQIAYLAYYVNNSILFVCFFAKLQCIMNYAITVSNLNLAKEINEL